jgi:hypothetical protein
MSQKNQFSVPESVRPIFGSAAGNLRFEFVLNNHSVPEEFEKSDAPFAILSSTGHLSKTMLARIAVGKDTTICYIAVKMQRNQYPPGTIKDQMTNEKIDELWESEQRNLSRLSGKGYEIVGLFDLTGAGEQPGADNSDYQSKPVTFCKRKKVYFHPVCPECGAFLADCRDEILLARNGLPSYSKTNVRYLFCELCASEKKRNIFFTYSLNPEELLNTKVMIRRRSELYRDFSALIHKKTSEANAELAAVFPCYNCEFNQTCYPPDSESGTLPAEQLLIPVTYYNSIFLPLELLHVHYDDLIDLLGGAPWEEVEKMLQSRGLSIAQQLIIEELRPFFSSKYQFIFQDEPSGLFALEILRLKLIAFTQLCRGVLAFHQECRRPHLDLRPGSLMARLALTGRDLPARWNFGIKLLDLGATMPFQYRQNQEVDFSEIFIPPYNFQKMFTAPVIANSQFGLEQKMNVAILKVTAVKDAADNLHAVIEADLNSQEIKHTDFTTNDLFRIMINSPASGLHSFPIWVTKSSGHERGMRVTGQTGVIEESMFEKLVRNTGNTFYDTNIGIFKTYHVPCDVYSVGILLLRTILVNEQQELWRVIEAVDQIRFRLGNQPAQNPEHIRSKLVGLLNENRAIFSPDAIFFKKSALTIQKNKIPHECWTDLLVFAFRLMTHIPGFSFCATHGDYEIEKPAAKMTEIVAELEELNKRIHADLFGSREENREILEICDALIGQLEGE